MEQQHPRADGKPSWDLEFFNPSGDSNDAHRVIHRPIGCRAAHLKHIQNRGLQSIMIVQNRWTMMSHKIKTKTINWPIMVMLINHLLMSYSKGINQLEHFTLKHHGDKMANYAIRTFFFIAKQWQRNQKHPGWNMLKWVLNDTMVEHFRNRTSKINKKHCSTSRFIVLGVFCANGLKLKMLTDAKTRLWGCLK